MTPPSLIVSFPEVSHPDLLDVAVGMVQTMTSALFVGGADVALADPAPTTATGSFLALEGLHGTVLTHHGAFVGEHTFVLETRVRRQAGGAVVTGFELRNEHGQRLWQRAFGGDATHVLGGLVGALQDIAALLCLRTVPRAWQVLVPEARSVDDALHELASRGAASLSLRLQEHRLHAASHVSQALH